MKNMIAKWLLRLMQRTQVCTMAQYTLLPAFGYAGHYMQRYGDLTKILLKQTGIFLNNWRSEGSNHFETNKCLDALVKINAYTVHNNQWEGLSSKLPPQTYDMSFDDQLVKKGMGRFNQDNDDLLQNAGLYDQTYSVWNLHCVSASDEGLLTVVAKKMYQFLNQLCNNSALIGKHQLKNFERKKSNEHIVSNRNEPAASLLLTIDSFEWSEIQVINFNLSVEGMIVISTDLRRILEDCLFIGKDSTKSTVNDTIRKQLFKPHAATMVDHNLSYDGLGMELNYSTSNEVDELVIRREYPEFLPKYFPQKLSALWQSKDCVLFLFQDVHVIVEILHEVLKGEQQIFVCKLIRCLLVDIGRRKNAQEVLSLARNEQSFQAILDPNSYTSEMTWNSEMIESILEHLIPTML